MPHPIPDPLVELIARRFRAMSEPMRIRLLDRLREGEATVAELTEALGASQQNVSKHLCGAHRRGHPRPAQGRQPRLLPDRRRERARDLRGGLRQRSAPTRRAPADPLRSRPVTAVAAPAVTAAARGRARRRERRSARPSRPFHGDSSPRRRDLLARRRRRARRLCAAGRDGTLGRRLAGLRLAVGSGTRSDP